jgi:hypothetical protein
MSLSEKAQIATEGEAEELPANAKEPQVQPTPSAYESAVAAAQTQHLAAWLHTAASKHSAPNPAKRPHCASRILLPHTTRCALLPHTPGMKRDTHHKQHRILERAILLLPQPTLSDSSVHAPVHP